MKNILSLLGKVRIIFVAKPVIATIVSIAIVGTTSTVGIVTYNKIQENKELGESIDTLNTNSNNADSEDKDKDIVKVDDTNKAEISQDEVEKLIVEEEKKTSNDEKNDSKYLVNDNTEDSDEIVSKANQTPKSTPSTEEQQKPAPEPILTQPQAQTPPPVAPTKPSGVDSAFASECYNFVKNSGSNCDYQDLVGRLDNYLNDLFLNQNAGVGKIKNLMENYVFNGFDVVWAAQVEKFELPGNATVQDFKAGFTKNTTDNYLYVQSYYNGDTDKYTIYYVGAALDHVSIYKATKN